MTYLVLARKWRPQTFTDLVGQDHVARTLSNAIGTDRVAHAFLFTGVRGVGKTSSARILAKALNCEKGPTDSPCQTCDACKEIGEGTSVDVQEIDGASYTGVDAVRSLQESLPYRPARDRYKIYIVDEVHMLSTAAWNAFLKTLEEPPPHVKFIFATTEVNKVPVTILSRCQRYDFKLIRNDAIAKRLRKVLEAEKIAAEDAALNIIAREAAGSMRDAMSLLDQVIAWVGGSDEALSSDTVARVLGVAARSVLHRLGEALIEGKASDCLNIIAELAKQGFPMTTVARDFMAHLRELVIAKVSESPEQLLELADGELADARALAGRTKEEDLSRLYLGMSRAYDDIARSSQPRAAFEMALVRLAQRPPLLPVDELLRRLADLERRLGNPPPDGGAAGGGHSRGGQEHGRARGPARSGGASGSRNQGSAAPSEGSALADGPPFLSEPPPVSEAPFLSQPPSPSERPIASKPPLAGKSPGAPEPTNAFAMPARFGTAKRSDATPRAARGPGAATADQPRYARTPKPHATGPDAPRKAAPGSPGLSSPAAPAPPASNAKPLEASQLKDWEAILDIVRVQGAALASIFEHGTPLAIKRIGLLIGYEAGSFLLQQASAPQAQQHLKTAAAKHFGEEVPVELDESGRHGEIQTVAARNMAASAARVAAARQRVADHPLVTAAVELLGAELRDVKLPS